MLSVVESESKVDLPEAASLDDDDDDDSLTSHIWIQVLTGCCLHRPRPTRTGLQQRLSP